MSNNKQTSIEWLIEHVKSTEWQDMYIWHKEEIFQQAKAMYKEELLNIFNCGRHFEATGEDTFNEIYNEIYGSKDNIDNTLV